MWGSSNYASKDKKVSAIAVSCIPRLSFPNYTLEEVQIFSWMSNNGVSLSSNENMLVNEKSGILLLHEPPSAAILKCIVELKNGDMDNFKHIIMEFKPAKLDPKISITVRFHQECTMGHLDPIIDSVKRPIYQLISRIANESAQTHGELIYGVGRSFEASFRTEQIVLEYQQQNENNEEKTLCSVTLIYHPFSQAMMENLREKIDENIACLNMKCRAQLLEDLLLLPEFREKLFRKEVIEELQGIVSMKHKAADVRISDVALRSACPPGFYLVLQLLCVPCPPGTYQTNTTSHDNPVVHRCSTCTGHTYQSSFGQLQCTTCPATLKVDANKRSCYEHLTFSSKALADDELKDMVGEAEETSYNLGELPTTDESRLADFLAKRFSSFLIVVVCNVSFVAILFFGTLGYFYSKKKREKSKKGKQISIDEFKRMSRALKKKFDKEDEKISLATDGGIEGKKSNKKNDANNKKNLNNKKNKNKVNNKNNGYNKINTNNTNCNKDKNNLNNRKNKFVNDKNKKNEIIQNNNKKNNNNNTNLNSNINNNNDNNIKSQRNIIDNENSAENDELKIAFRYPKSPAKPHEIMGKLNRFLLGRSEGQPKVLKMPMTG